MQSGVDHLSTGFLSRSILLGILSGGIYGLSMIWSLYGLIASPIIYITYITYGLVLGLIIGMIIAVITLGITYKFFLVPLKKWKYRLVMAITVILMANLPIFLCLQLFVYSVDYALVSFEIRWLIPSIILAGLSSQYVAGWYIKSVYLSPKT